MEEKKLQLDLDEDYEQILKFVEGCSLVTPDIIKMGLKVGESEAKRIMMIYKTEGLLEKNEKDGNWYYYYRDNPEMKNIVQEIEIEAEKIYVRKHKYDWLKFWKINRFSEKAMKNYYEIWEIQKNILKEKYNYDWKSPDDLSPEGKLDLGLMCLKIFK